MSKSKTSSPLIQKALDALSTQDVKDNWAAVQAAIAGELNSFVDHSVFKRIPRTEASNICSSRWVLRWKLINGTRSIKARLTIRGFQDQQEVNSYAATASRWSQRLVVSVAVKERWQLWIADVATAFLQSDTFAQLTEEAGDEIRNVCFTPPAGYESEFLKLKGHENMNFTHEVFRLLRPAYGLKDAPRAWKRRLDKILRELGGIPVPTDASLYAFYDSLTLVCLLATHVDDIKGAGTKAATKRILQGLTVAFGQLKTSFDKFEHCGLLHDTGPDGVKISQEHHAAQLRPVPVVDMNTKLIDVMLTVKQTQAFQSVLGGLSWLVQTRGDICIYVVALQRVATRATVGHALKLNQLVKWVRKQPCFLFYPWLRGSLKLVCISDAAFRRENAAGLSMRGAIIAVAEEGHGTKMHIIEYYSRKQRRVCRSTFSAELNGGADAYETARLISITWSAIYSPGKSAAQLSIDEGAGQLLIKIDLYIDCFSIFESLSQEQVRVPSEQTLILLLLSLKEALVSRQLRALVWVDTRDQLADALTKGAITRRDLVKAFCEGCWILKHDIKVFSEPLRK